MTQRGRRKLENVIGYLYTSLDPRGGEEHELKRIVLRMLSLAKQGMKPSLDLASAYSGLGKSFNHWRDMTAERRWRQAQELMRCIPDYDPTLDTHNLAQRLAEKGIVYPLPSPSHKGKAGLDDTMPVSPSAERGDSGAISKAVG